MKNLKNLNRPGPPAGLLASGPWLLTSSPWLLAPAHLDQLAQALSDFLDFSDFQIFNLVSFRLAPRRTGPGQIFSDFSGLPPALTRQAVEASRLHCARTPHMKNLKNLARPSSAGSKMQGHLIRNLKNMKHLNFLEN